MYFGFILYSKGIWLQHMQDDIPWAAKDMTFLEYFRKSYEYEHDLEKKKFALNNLRATEIRYDFYRGSLKSISNLIQFDAKPNFELKETRCEIYKISISFEPIRKMNSLFNSHHTMWFSTTNDP